MYHLNALKQNGIMSNINNTESPNYLNLAILHNTLLSAGRGVFKHEAGVWVGTYYQGNVDPLSFTRSSNLKAFQCVSVFGFAVLSGVPEFVDTDKDYHRITLRGVNFECLDWGAYMRRVFNMNMGMPEYNWIDTHRWRTRDPSLQGAIARIRYVIDNCLDRPSNADLIDVLHGSELPYDILENRPYDFSKPL